MIDLDDFIEKTECPKCHEMLLYHTLQVADVGPRGVGLFFECPRYVSKR